MSMVIRQDLQDVKAGERDGSAASSFFVTFKNGRTYSCTTLLPKSSPDFSTQWTIAA
jgi:hypothetical protein